MSYELALEKAGATVHCFEQFGSYQGDWYAKITYNGQTGWIAGSYGSCCGCDAFEAEFGWSTDEMSDYEERLAQFGSSYLEPLLTQEEVEKKASRYLEWDSEAQQVLEFLKANKI